MIADQTAIALPVAQQQWALALSDLRSQIPQGTFENLVRDTRVIEATEDRYTIATQSAISRDWLQNRLYDTLQRALAHVTHQPQICLEFVVDLGLSPVVPAPEPTESPAITVQATQPGLPLALDGPVTETEIKFISDTAMHRLKMDMGYWLPEFHYDQNFWFRYLKRGAYFLRRRLETHWLERYAKKEERDLNDPANHWTSAFRVRYREMARWLGLKKVEVISGGEEECRNCYLARLKEKPLTTCCGKHPFHDWRQDKDRNFKCYHWQRGMLHRLHEENLLAINIVKPAQPGQPRAHQILVQVWRVLPFLTPAQVETMDSLTRKEHELWLQRFGQERFGLSQAQWEDFQATSHVPLMGYNQEGRRLHGEPETDPFAPPGNHQQATSPVDLDDEEDL